MNDKALKQPLRLLIKTLFFIFGITSFATIYAADNVDATTTKIPSTTASTTFAPPTNPTPTSQHDPYERFNRVMFSFNDKLDVYLLKPVATVYNKIMPRPLNRGIHNIFSNLNNLPTIANDALQFNIYQMSNDLWRLGINTTIGIGGFFDVAQHMNLAPYTNDFGLTLVNWGYSQSNYLVLPFWGSYTVRDGIIGVPVDYFAFSIYPYINPVDLRYEVYVLNVVDRRAQLLQYQSFLDEAAFDRYVFIRDASLQRRNYEIERNKHLSYGDRDRPLPTPND